MGDLSKLKIMNELRIASYGIRLVEDLQGDAR